MALPGGKLAKKKKQDESDEEDVDIDQLLRDPIVLTAEVQLFSKYTLPTAEEGGILCGLPPNSEKPWRVEMSSDTLTDGGVNRVLRISRRGVMFFCDDDTVELSVNIAPVTVLEAVYENSVWEPADGYIALDTVPLDRNGHPPEKPDLLLIMRLPPHAIQRFETLAVLFGRCTKRSARRHRDAKPVSIVARHAFKNEMTKYAARLAEEEEARKKAAEEGGEAGVGGEILKPAAAADVDDAAAKKKKEQAAAAAKDEFDEDETSKKKTDASDDGGGVTPGADGGLLSPASDSLDPNGEQPQEMETVYAINPFAHDLIHTPDVFDYKVDDAAMTALDAEHLRRHRDRDSDTQLYTKTRALYFGSSSDDRANPAVDALNTLLQRGRELAALGKPTMAEQMRRERQSMMAVTAGGGETEAGAGSPESAAAGAAANPLADGGGGGAEDENAGASLGDSPDVSPRKHKSFMEAFSYRETTRVQRAQLEAFFADAEAERRDQQARDTALLTKLLADVKAMTTKIDVTAREVRLSGASAPRRRTPPWVRPEPPRKPPTVQPDRMPLRHEQLVNPFSAIGRRM